MSTSVAPTTAPEASETVMAAGEPNETQGTCLSRCMEALGGRVASGAPAGTPFRVKEDVPPKEEFLPVFIAPWLRTLQSLW